VVSFSQVYVITEFSSSWHLMYPNPSEALVQTGIISYQYPLVRWSKERPIRKSIHNSGILLAGQMCW